MGGGHVGQMKPINCKTVGSHPLRGQSRTTDAAVRLLRYIVARAVSLPNQQLEQQQQQKIRRWEKRKVEYKNANSTNGGKKERETHRESIRRTVKEERESKGRI